MEATKWWKVSLHLRKALSRQQRAPTTTGPSKTRRPCLPPSERASHYAKCRLPTSPSARAPTKMSRPATSKSAGTFYSPVAVLCWSFTPVAVLCWSFSRPKQNAQNEASATQSGLHLRQQRSKTRYIIPAVARHFQVCQCLDHSEDENPRGSGPEKMNLTNYSTFTAHPQNMTQKVALPSEKQLSTYCRREKTKRCFSE